MHDHLTSVRDNWESSFKWKHFAAVFLLINIAGIFKLFDGQICYLNTDRFKYKKCVKTESSLCNVQGSGKDGLHIISAQHYLPNREGIVNSEEKTHSREDGWNWTTIITTDSVQ